MSWSTNYTKVEVAQPQTSSGSIKGEFPNHFYITSFSLNVEKNSSFDLLTESLKFLKNSIFELSYSSSFQLNSIFNDLLIEEWSGVSPKRPNTSMNFKLFDKLNIIFVVLLYFGNKFCFDFIYLLVFAVNFLL